MDFSNVNKCKCMYLSTVWSNIENFPAQYLHNNFKPKLKKLT